MGFVKMTCPNCGANFDMNGDLDFGVCNFCGTKVAIDKTIVEHRGTVKVKGVADSDAILDRALLFLEDGNFSEAIRYCERALDLNPRNHEAYIIKLMSQTHCKKRSDLANQLKPLETYDCFQKAVRFAPSEVQDELHEYNRRTVARFEETKAQMINELETLKTSIDTRRHEVDKSKFWTDKHKTLLTVLIIVSVVLALLLSRVHAVLLLIVVILMIAGIILLKHKRNKGDKLISEQNTLISTFNQKSDAFRSWLDTMKKTIS